MKKISLLFPGQGSQYVGMGKNLFDRYSAVREIFQEANEAIGFDLKKLCFEGNIEELTKTENAQPAILTVGVAAFNVFMNEFGIMPQFAAGHSLGEITALTCAGAINFYDAVKIVKRRGIFMREAVAQDEGSMLAIRGIDINIIKSECDKFCVGDNIVNISNYNSPVQIVISGRKKAVNQVGDKLKELGGKITALKVSGPFHSALMQLAADNLKIELKKYKYKELRFPVISNLNALPYKDKESIIQNLSKQVVSPVQWKDSMEFLGKQDNELILDMGPKGIVKNLLKENMLTANSYEYDNENERVAVHEFFKYQAVEQKDSVRFIKTLIKKCISIAICTPNKNFNSDEYEKGVIKPYREIKKLQEKIELEAREPKQEEMRQALVMLRSVFDTKKVPVEEQIERFNEVFDETETRELFSDFKMPVKTSW